MEFWTTGCFPSLATIPILWGLYRTLSNVATEGLLDSEGFFWIPTLGGPTTVAARQAGSGTSWLFPLENGAPPIGWEEAAPYLVLPILLVVCQYVSSSIIQPPVDPNAEDSNGQWVQYLVKLLPLLVGYFSLTLPSGLSLYYFSNIVFTSGQQIYLRKGGGADVRTAYCYSNTTLGHHAWNALCLTLNKYLAYVEDRTVFELFILHLVSGKALDQSLVYLQYYYWLFLSVNNFYAVHVTVLYKIHKPVALVLFCHSFYAESIFKHLLWPLKTTNLLYQIEF